MKLTNEDMAQFRSMLGLVRGVDTEKRTVKGYASTGAVDRYGEIVLPSAFEKDLPAFLRDRHIFAANHRYVSETGEPLVIGKVTSGRIDSKGLFIEAVFDTDPISEAWFKKFKNGMVKAFSIGFIPKKWETRQMTIDGVDRSVRVYTEVELLEISAVPIPANPQALVAAASGGRSDGAVLDMLRDIKDGIQQLMMLQGGKSYDDLGSVCQRDYSSLGPSPDYEDGDADLDNDQIKEMFV